MKRNQKTLRGLLIAFVMIGMLSFSATAQTRIIPHLTPASGGFVGFDGSTFPANFFGPGSDPFEGIVNFESRQHTQLEISGAVAITGDSVVDVEIVALDLVSSQPITVTYNGGQNPELWDMEIWLSELNAPTSQFVLTGDGTGGGTFTGSLVVQPFFRFTPVGGGSSREVDTAGLLDPIQFDLANPFPGPYGRGFGHNFVQGIFTGLIGTLDDVTADQSAGISLLAVPEPSAAILLLGLGVMGVSRRR